MSNEDIIKDLKNKIVTIVSKIDTDDITLVYKGI